MEGYLVKSKQNVSSMSILELQSSQGNLDKWSGFVGGQRCYIKACSSRQGSRNYECEAECIASRLAIMLGVPDVVMYYNDILNLGSRSYTVCCSKDFNSIGGSYYRSYNRILAGSLNCYGLEKYRKVVSFAPVLRQRIDTILIFDSIIGNNDRHLRNIGVLELSDGSKHIPLFDNGNSLFYDKNNDFIRNILKSDLDYLPCKPFFSTFGNQIKLCDLSTIRLKRVQKEAVYRLVNSYFTGERAKLICKFLILRLRRYNLV